MYKTIKALYQNGRIICKEAMPQVKKAKLLTVRTVASEHYFPIEVFKTSRIF
jgi:hypothetical protein